MRWGVTSVTAVILAVAACSGEQEAAEAETGAATAEAPVEQAAAEPAAPETAEPGGLAPGSRPNILLIVGDDLGYQDLGLFGSEIETPNIDALAGQGVILTNFYSSVACQPTRAMLMSGADNHVAGVGSQGRVIDGNPYYQNALNDRVVPIAERMAEAGYHTYMSGKWHLGSGPGQTPAERGFERSFVLIHPGAGHFEDMMPFGPNMDAAHYQLDGEDLDSLREGFYSTIDYTNHMIEYIDLAAQDDAPFFGYLAYTAPHWPIHALPEDMEKTQGRYDAGWDVLREQRWQAWKDLGYAPADAEAPGLVHTYQPWDSLSDEEKAVQSRTMEAYAAMVERLDAEIGRLVDHLRETGELDNTLIVFMSDNGAEYLGNDWPGMAEYFASFDNSLDNIGHPNSYMMPGPGWGEASSASYYLSKGYLSEGGTHVPAFVAAPGLGLAPGQSDAVIAAFDMAPTFLELAGADPDAHSGPDTAPITGRSFADVLRGEPGAARGQTQINFEHGGQRVARRGDWKAIRLGEPNGTGDWQLFNLAEDPSERIDVAAENPDLLADMTAEWQVYAESHGVDLTQSGSARVGETDEEAAELEAEAE